FGGEGVGVGRAVLEEEGDVSLDGLGRGADDLVAPIEVVEVLVPEVGPVLGFAPALADAEVRGSEQGDSGNAIGMGADEALGEKGAKIVADEADAREAEFIDEFEDVGGDGTVVVAGFGRKLWFLGVSETAKVEGDAIEAILEGGDVA